MTTLKGIILLFAILGASVVLTNLTLIVFPPHHNSR